MKILVLNCGSSSVKYKLIDSATKQVLAEGGVEKIGLPDSFLKYKRPDGSKEVIETPMKDAKDAVRNILNLLTDPKEGVVKSFDEIEAENPVDYTTRVVLREQLDEVLDTLTDREENVLRLRFGLDDGKMRTLEDVGKVFNVTRERIRQIEAKALRKLRHPSRSKQLKDFIED